MIIDFKTSLQGQSSCGIPPGLLSWIFGLTSTWTFPFSPGAAAVVFPVFFNSLMSVLGTGPLPPSPSLDTSSGGCGMGEIWAAGGGERDQEQPAGKGFPLGFCWLGTSRCSG